MSSRLSVSVQVSNPPAHLPAAFFWAHELSDSLGYDTSPTLGLVRSRADQYSLLRFLGSAKRGSLCFALPRSTFMIFVYIPVNNAKWRGARMKRHGRTALGK
jgi:hypothetical protein